MREDNSETKRKILTVCIRLFLEQGIKTPLVSQIVDEAGVARGSYLNLFPTKDRVLLELTETISTDSLAWQEALRTASCRRFTPHGGNGDPADTDRAERDLREIYIEAYSLPDTAEYIYLHTTAELKQIFGVNFPHDTEQLLRDGNRHGRTDAVAIWREKCDIHFPLWERKNSAVF